MTEVDDKTPVVEKDSKETSIESTNEQSNDTQYHIFDYFKEHPSLFITAASAFIAIISVFLNLTAFLNTNSYLNFFNIDNTIYRQSTQFVYFIAIALVFSAVTIFFQSFITKTYESYLPYKKLFLLYRYSLKSNKKELNHSKKGLRKIRNRLSKHSKSRSDKQAVEKILKEVDSLQEKNKKIRREYNSTKKIITKCRVVYFLIIGMSCFVALVILSAICFLLTSFDSYDWHKTILSSFMLSTIIVLAYSIENWFLTCVVQINRKELKADAQLDRKNRFLKYNKFSKFPLSSLFEGNIKYIFNDLNCKKFISSIIICLVVLILVSAWGGARSASKQKEFFIVNVDNQTYAIIYNNGENLALEKVDIIDNTLTIYTNQQKVISSNNVDMKKCVFNKVDIVREEQSFYVGSY